MAIHYALFENRLTPDPDDYAASVQAGDSADLDEIADRIIAGGSILNRAAILAVLESVLPAVQSLLLEGRRVNFGGLFEMFPRIKGVFDGPGDTFNPSRHQVDVGANPGSRVREHVRQNASVIKDEAVLPMPNLVQYLDNATGSINEDLTPNNVGRITGNRLKFDPADTDQGIFFIDTGNSAETRVAAMVDNQPSRLTFMTPSLPPGTYSLEVRVKIRGSTILRTGQLQNPLSVV